MMQEVKLCLWCGKKFEWDVSMYQFCDRCIRLLERVEEIVLCLTYPEQSVNVTEELEVDFERRQRKPNG